KELINCYKVIKSHIHDLIKELSILVNNYHALDSLIQKQELFNKYKDKFNNLLLNNKESKIKKAALFIFLNHTCFNGLYRVNSDNKFNVPFGKYLNPKIYDEQHLLLLSKLLKNVHIYCASYSKIKQILKKNNLSKFVYFDPPYLGSSTKNFTSYTKNNFDLKQQIKLAKLLHKIKNDSLFALTNSVASLDNEELNNLYSSFNIDYIDTIHTISCNSISRINHQELFVTNYLLNKDKNHE
ncbi:MAG: Dam family site-specific DNA-(adenine-N6)-methyltransferase, partial [Mycoplasmataceae bacterium]|nr:Dam family site-specific DNA-(adenine-N6)-methyltransferase [Mycoplasmataceae bacterium]